MAGTPKPQRRTFRYWLQQLHLWVGLILLALYVPLHLWRRLEDKRAHVSTPHHVEH